jgi:hypothetical protein
MVKQAITKPPSKHKKGKNHANGNVKMSFRSENVNGQVYFWLPKPDMAAIRRNQGNKTRDRVKGDERSQSKKHS